MTLVFMESEEQEDPLAMLGPTPVITGTATSTSTETPLPGSVIDLRNTINQTAYWTVTETGGTNAVSINVQISADGTHWFNPGQFYDWENQTGEAGEVELPAGTTNSYACGIEYLGQVALFARLTLKDQTSGSHGVISYTGQGA